MTVVLFFFQLTDLLQQYATAFRDPMMLQPPEWFKAFIYCEAFLQLPFFPVAAYAFLKGGGTPGGLRACPGGIFAGHLLLLQQRTFLCHG